MSTPYDPNDPSRQPDDQGDFDDPDLREEKPKPDGDDGKGDRKKMDTHICKNSAESACCREPDRPK